MTPRSPTKRLTPNMFTELFQKKQNADEEIEKVMNDNKF